MFQCSMLLYKCLAVCPYVLLCDSSICVMCVMCADVSLCDLCVSTCVYKCLYYDYNTPMSPVLPSITYTNY